MVLKHTYMLAALLLSSAGVAHATPDSGTGVAKSDHPASSATDLDKKVCRKSVETGTLSKRSKTCMTRRQWLAVSDDNRQPWEELQGSKGMTSGQ